MQCQHTQARHFRRKVVIGLSTRLPSIQLCRSFEVLQDLHEQARLCFIHDSQSEDMKIAPLSFSTCDARETRSACNRDRAGLWESISVTSRPQHHCVPTEKLSMQQGCRAMPNVVRQELTMLAFSLAAFSLAGGSLFVLAATSSWMLRSKMGAYGGHPWDERGGPQQVQELPQPAAAWSPHP